VRYHQSLGGTGVPKVGGIGGGPAFVDWIEALHDPDDAPRRVAKTEPTYNPTDARDIDPGTAEPRLAKRIVDADASVP
jgi:hypothetical protein